MARYHQMPARPSHTTTERIWWGVIAITVLGVWWAAYSSLDSLSRWLTSNVCGISLDTHLGASVQFFLYDTPKVLLLMLLVVFVVGILRTYITPERTRSIVAGKRAFVGSTLAALFGIVTPFCSCSAVPLFVGFVTAGIPLGVTFSFLISAPMINEIALVMLYGLFGWKIAGLYLATGLSIAISAGWLMGKLHLESHVQEWVYELPTTAVTTQDTPLTWAERVAVGQQTVRDIVGKVWLYIVLGIAIGAAIHGYVPQEYMASFMGTEAWWGVPLAVLIGIPLYSNAAGIIPIVDALLAKGAAMGTLLAFMMSVIALSLPEIIILRQVLKPRLIAIFVAVVGSGILFVGYLFNYIIKL